MDWFQTFIGPDRGGQTWEQLSVRAVVLFGLGIVCIRIAGRRTFSNATPLDIIVALVVGSNFSRVMTGGAAFIPSVAATLVLVCLHRLLAMATLRWNIVASLVKGRPDVLVRDGEVDETALFRHGLSRDDLLQGLRAEQVETPADAHLATIERSGRISVVPRRQ